MKKKNFGIISFFAAITLVLSACIFESDGDGLETWLSDRGMPSNYQVQTLEIKNLKPTSAKVYLDTMADMARSSAVFGHVSNLTHDLVFDFVFDKPKDTLFLSKFVSSDSANAYLVLYWQQDLYKSKWFPKKELPYSEKLDLTVSWKFENSSSSKFVDSIFDVTDSAWREELAEWNPSKSADTVFKMKMSAGDTAVRIQMPAALVADLKKIKKGNHLQLRLSAPGASREYRFWGSNTDDPPYLALSANAKETVIMNPMRIAHLLKNEEDCADCLVLHGGVLDSLVVEVPPEPVLEALSEFYGDEFPYTEGDGKDVRQTVIHAQITMLRDDSKGSNEFGWPIQVLSASYLDSADMIYTDDEDLRYCHLEGYHIDSLGVLKSGHPNLVFRKGDSLTLQLTYGLRDFINNASDGRNIKFMVRLGKPFLQERDPDYENYIASKADTLYNSNGKPVYVAKGDTVTKYFSIDYARYDFTTAMENPLTLKLWLASKRGDE